jgi:hypothetical protein
MTRAAVRAGIRWFTCSSVVGLIGCSTIGGNSSAPKTSTVPVRRVSVNTFGSKGGDYFAAIKTDALFEEREGCLYVGDDQAVWFLGTTVRQKPGTTTVYEVLDAEGRKLAETGTIVSWGGGQVSGTVFYERLVASTECKQRNDKYWVVGKIESPRFEANN